MVHEDQDRIADHSKVFPDLECQTKTSPSHLGRARKKEALDSGAWRRVVGLIWVRRLSFVE